MDEIKIITVRNHPLPALLGVLRSNAESIACWLAACIISVYSQQQSPAIGHNSLKLLFMQLCLQCYKGQDWFPAEQGEPS